MIFEADLVKGKKSKDPSKIKSKAFSVAKNFDGATHVKLKGVNQFKVIGDVKIKRKKDADGNPRDEFIKSSDFTPVANEEYVCVVGGNEFPIESQLYAQTVLMKKAEGNKGKFYRCDDGVYIHKYELQVPAYKKLETHAGAELRGPAYGGKYLYVDQEVLKLKSGGQKIVLTEELKSNPSVVRRNALYEDSWEYFVDGRWEECTHHQGVDTRVLVRQVMIGDKIVDVGHIKQDASGNLSVDIDGFGPIETGKTVDLESPFIDIAPANYDDKEGVLIETKYVPADDVNIRTGRATERSGGKVKIGEDYIYAKMFDNNTGKYIYTTSTSVRIGEGSDAVTYALYGAPVYQREGKIYRVKSIKAKHHSLSSDTTKSGRYSKYEFDFEDPQEVSLEYLNTDEELARKGPESPNKKKKEYYPVGDGRVNNLEWKKIEGKDQIESYEMNGVTFSNIAWEGGEIKSCTIQYTNEEGESVKEETDNIKKSLFKNLAIKCTQIDKLDNVEINEDATVSFKLGNYEFKDAVVGENGKIGKCKLKTGDGEFQEVDLANEPRFEQLKVSINAILVDQEIVPLIQSKLLEKKDGKYERVADVVQTQPLYTEEEWAKLSDEEKASLGGQYGVVSAKEVGSVSEVIDAQKQFRDNPFKTQVIDDKDKNRVHIINDVKTTYEGASEFEFDISLIPDFIGKDKIEIKDGKVVIDSKKENGRVDDAVVIGFALCSNPLTLILGIPVLFAGAAMGVGFIARRAIKKHRLENMDIEEVTRKIQKRIKKQCHENINKYEKNYRNQLKIYRKRLSQNEYTEKAKQLREEFEFNCRKELGNLQGLGQGAINCPFDLSKKSKLTRDNILGYFAANQEQRILRDGVDRKRLRKIKWEYRHKLGFGFRKALKEENKKRYELDQEGITAKDFRKQLRNERDSKMVFAGGIKEELEFFKNSPKYKAATIKERREMLKDAKKAAQEKLLVKTEQVQFNEMYDKKGNSVVLSETKSADAFIQSVVDKGDGYSKRTKFNSGFVYEHYDEARSFHSAVERKIYKNDEQRCARDKGRGLEAIQKFENEKLAQVETNLSQLRGIVEQGVQTEDYEELLKLQVITNRKAKEQNEKCKNASRKAEEIPYKELNEAEVEEVSRKIYNAQTNIRASQIKVDERKQERQEAYKKQVVQWAKADYIKSHKGEFEEYCKEHQKEVKRNLKADPNLDISKVMITGFMAHMQKTVGAKAVADEMAVHRAVNNVEDNIMAELFCEQPHKKANYEAWVAEQNRNGANLDVNSERARCGYYVYCEKQDVRAMNNFRTSSKEAFEQKAQERIDNETLVTSSEKQEKVDKMNKNIKSKLNEKFTAVAHKIKGAITGKSEAKVAPSSAPVLAR